MRVSSWSLTTVPYQSLFLFTDGYPNDQLIYSWDKNPVTFNSRDFALSQFDIVKTISRNGTYSFKRGKNNSQCINGAAPSKRHCPFPTFSVGNHSMLQVNFNLRRHVGYFLIQIYVPASLIVVLSWVSFWINRFVDWQFELSARFDLPIN